MPLEKLGPYKLEKILGRGGMGAVYVGLHEQTGERAAVKVLSGHLADDEAFRERFKIEVETLKRLAHPNIVQLAGFGEDDGHLFYVMELVQGRSLHDELAAGRRFNWREVTRIGIAVAHALKHAHDRGIIHRDLKPANLLLDEQDHVKLTDFGIAKLYGGTSVTADGGVLGTADYMAPEQAEGKQINSRCDLYSLGSVLYALLVGRPPFVGKSIVQVIAALKNDKPVGIRRLAPDTPEELENIVLQLLEKEPQQRIPTAKALANRLKAMEHALSLETRVIEPGEIEIDDDLRLAPEEGPNRLGPSNPTAPLGQTALRPTSKETKPLPPAGDRDYRVAGLLPTTVTGIGGQAPPVSAPGSLPANSQAATHATGIAAKGGAAAVHGANTVAEPGGGAVEGTSDRKTHFTLVSEAELRRGGSARLPDDAPPRHWLTAGLLLLAAAGIFGTIVFFAARPPSADALYDRVKQAMDEGGAQQLVGVEPDLARFLATFPSDERAGELTRYQEELDLYRLQKRFEMRARRPGGGIEALAPVERAYLEAVQLVSSDPEQALARFQALVDVYGGEPDPALSGPQKKTSQQCLDLAGQQVERLRASVDKLNAEQRQALRRQLDRATQLAKSDPTTAAAMWRGIVTLYAGKPWAKDLVEQAAEQLSRSRLPGGT